MRFTVYTLFPGLVTPYLGEALLARAIREGIVEVEVRDLRRFAGNRTGRVDDAPYGGGAGMVMRVDVAASAIDEAAGDDPPPDEVVLLTPAGERLTQPLVEELASRRHVCLLSARYEGFDARVELPALCVIEAVTRLLPGALGDEESHRQDSFASGLLDYPEYTRPAEFRGLAVPEVLLSGHHGNVAAWRRREALRRTLLRRPDLLARAALTEEDERELARLRAELGIEGVVSADADEADG